MYSSAPSATFSPYGPDVGLGPGHAGYTRRLGGFEVEHTPNRAPSRLPGEPEPRPREEEEEEIDLPTAVGRLLGAKAHPFSIGGKIPLDPADLTLFFRSQSGVTHSLDFPVDLETHAAPAFDVLVTSCQPVDLYAQPSGGPPAMMYPAQLPFSTTLELANRPILAAIQSSLVPVLPPGHYVTAVRERLDVLMTSGRSFSGRTPNAGDGRIATLLVTLPVRFRGGDLVIRSHFDGRTERFHHSKKGHSGQLEWVAWTEGSEVEIETIKKGCRVDLRFGIYLQSFGPGGSQLEPLITPPEDFRSLLGAVLNLSRGRRIGFYLTKEYGVNPAEASAASLIPMLSGGDMLLYEALRMFELVPELHWTAGGYIWPADRVVDMTAEPPSHSPNSSLRRRSGHSPPSSTVRGAFAPYGMPVPQGEADEVERLKVRVEAGGASPLATADIMVLADWDDSQAGGGAVAGKERVSFVSGGELGRLVVHVLLVVYVA